MRKVCRRRIYELYSAVLFTVNLKCVNMLFLFGNDTNLLPTRDECGYSKTTNMFTSACEGIPENLLLNVLGWMVGNRSHPVGK